MRPSVQDFYPVEHGVNRPSNYELKFAESTSAAADALELFGTVEGDRTLLSKGDRVFLLTVGEEYPGTVIRDWRPADDAFRMIQVALDSDPENPVEFHRSLFRAFTALDHLAQA